MYHGHEGPKQHRITIPKAATRRETATITFVYLSKIQRQSESGENLVVKRKKMASGVVTECCGWAETGNRVTRDSIGDVFVWRTHLTLSCWSELKGGKQENQTHPF